jgi:hypothetical protein
MRFKIRDRTAEPVGDYVLTKIDWDCEVSRLETQVEHLYLDPDDLENLFRTIAVHLPQLAKEPFDRLFDRLHRTTLLHLYHDLCRRLGIAHHDVSAAPLPALPAQD